MDSKEVGMAGFHSATRRCENNVDSFSEKEWNLPSNAAATLLLIFCVVSNALAAAAAEGGLLVVIFRQTFFKDAQLDLLSQRITDIDSRLFDKASRPDIRQAMHGWNYGS